VYSTTIYGGETKNYVAVSSEDVRDFFAFETAAENLFLTNRCAPAAAFVLLGVSAATTVHYSSVYARCLPVPSLFLALACPFHRWMEDLYRLVPDGGGGASLVRLPTATASDNA